MYSVQTVCAWEFVGESFSWNILIFFFFFRRLTICAVRCCAVRLLNFTQMKIIAKQKQREEKLGVAFTQNSSLSTDIIDSIIQKRKFFKRIIESLNRYAMS